MDLNFEEENWNDDDNEYVPDVIDLTEEEEDEDDYDPCNGYDDFFMQSGKSEAAGKKESKPKPKSTITEKTKKDVNKPLHENSIKKPRRNLKVELRTISISNDTKDHIMNTLRSIHGENFSLNTVVPQSKRKLSDRYWVNQGHLIVRNCYDYSNKSNIYKKEKVNSLLLENLERYGFCTNHCYEALIHTNNEFDKSLQLLLEKYFEIKFKHHDSVFKSTAEMDDEIIALKSIYEDVFEEKVKHKHWIFHLELTYLAEWYFQNSKHKETYKKRTYDRTKRMCHNFSYTGACRFGSRCKFSHEILDTMKNSTVQNEEIKLKSCFDLEIRFPDGCHYPNDVPIILFAALHKEFSSHICLRITKYLLKEACECAKQGDAFCFNLVDLLQNSENILLWLKNEAESKLNIDPKQPLLKAEPMWIDDCENEPSSSTLYSQEIHRVDRKIAPRDTTINRDNEVVQRMISKYHDRYYRQMQNERRKLPASGAEHSILQALSKHQVVVIVGETGCGKSTQIPQFILDEWVLAAAGMKNANSMNERVEIICTQPRRLSAIGVASRVAQERFEKPGEVVGYQIRLESCTSSLTKLLFCTTGILLKKLENDPLLETTTHVIVDEVHERSEESDFLLLILKELMTIRPDLKIILMSATMNADLFSTYFGGAPLIEIPGKMFPVAELFIEDMLELCDYTIDEYSKFCRKVNKTMSRQIDDLECNLALADSMTSDTVSRVASGDECLSAKQLFYRYRDYSFKTRKTLLLMDPEKIDVEMIISILTWIVGGDHNYPREGSILVFLPGLADITAVNDDIMCHPILSPRTGRFIIIPLHSTISNEDQSIVFRRTPPGVRKIVLSTNIAETSITIDDCVFVIDCGKMKETRFDTNKNMSSLETVWISRANAHQRKGRAGRVMPGLCIRLYTQHRFKYVFKAQPIPEIQRVPLDQIILRTRALKNFKSRTIENVLEKIVEPPPINNIETAVERLQNVGALDEDKELTALGRHLSVLPVDVKIGKLILFGAVFCCLDSVLTIAASLSNKSPFVSPFTKRDIAEAKKREFSKCNSDHLTVLNAYKKWQNIIWTSKWIAGKRFAEENFLSWRTLEVMGDLKHQYLDLLVSIGFVNANTRIRRRHHEDKVRQMTSNELNKNGDNYQLLSGIICAALYPNLVEVLTPDKQYTAGVSGAMPREYSFEELKFNTRSDGFVNLHPSSVNYGVGNFISPYLVYQEKMKTTKVFIHDSTMVTPVSLVLLAGAQLKIEANAGTYIASLEDGWITFSFRSVDDAKMLEHMRLAFSNLLEKKIENPCLNLVEDNLGKKIISTMAEIISRTSA